jgi:hypothetical protein
VSKRNSDLAARAREQRTGVPTGGSRDPEAPSIAWTWWTQDQNKRATGYDWPEPPGGWRDPTEPGVNLPVVGWLNLPGSGGGSDP